MLTPPIVEPDTSLPLAAACRLLPGDEPITRKAASARRWITVGLLDRDGGRLRLAGRRIGGRWHVRPADLTAFLAAINEPTDDGLGRGA